MLSNKVCQRCVNNNARKSFDSRGGQGIGSAHWDNVVDDTRLWGEGTVICPYPRDFGSIDAHRLRHCIHEPPPSWCGHTLEHAVVAGIEGV